MAESGQQESSIRVQAKQILVPPTIRVVMSLVLLVVIRFLVVRIPGVDIVIFGPDITIATILYSGITLIMFGAILKYASSVGVGLAQLSESFPEIERIIQLIGVLVVLAWAYQVFWWLPYFRENMDHYDLVFLIAGIVFVGWLGYLAYSNVDKVSALVSRQVIEEFDEEEFEGQDDENLISSVTGVADKASDLISEDEPGDQEEPTPTLGHTESVDTSSDTAEPTDTDATSTESPDSPESDSSNVCPECGTELPEEAKFCNACGTEVTGDET